MDACPTCLKTDVSLADFNFITESGEVCLWNAA
jgi:hypothetical protein